jgi:hypothetical protein
MKGKAGAPQPSEVSRTSSPLWVSRGPPARERVLMLQQAALSGVVPLIFVAWTTSPFVLMVAVRLPPVARASEEHLRRYLARLPSDTVLSVATMSPIAKPRLSRVKLSELRQTSQRLGIVNYVRDASAENALRKWYNFRAVDKFSIQTNRVTGPHWYWDSIAKLIPKDKP